MTSEPIKVLGKSHEGPESGLEYDPKTIQVHQIVQIVPAHKWQGALIVVSELKSFGIQGYCEMPSNDGKGGQAYIRLKWTEFIPTGGTAVFIPKGEEDDPK